jgi:hypothetical protein
LFNEKRRTMFLGLNVLFMAIPVFYFNFCSKEERLNKRTRGSAADMFFPSGTETFLTRHLKYGTASRREPGPL